MSDEHADGHEHGDPGSGDIAIRPLAESALLAVLGERIDPAIIARALALAAALEAAAIAGVLDVVPAYATVLVAFDPEAVDGDALAEAVRAHAAGLAHAAPPPGREVAIPVRYGGAMGPDLADVAAHAGMSAAEVVRRHAAAEYRVACMGFCPGFAYLLGLPDELRVPRRATPRTRVPVGSVAIGGAQTGIYPLATPGGWNVVGHTDVALFDPSRDEPILLRPGDRLRFVPVGGDAIAHDSCADGDGRAGPIADSAAPRPESSGRDGADCPVDAVTGGQREAGGRGRGGRPSRQFAGARRPPRASCRPLTARPGRAALPEPRIGRPGRTRRSAAMRRPPSSPSLRRG